MGIDYACIIGEGVAFSEAFIRRLPAEVVDKIRDGCHGDILIIKTLYKNTSVQMFDDGDYDMLPSILDPGRPRADILNDAWAVLELTDTEKTIVDSLKETDDLRVGLMIQHYAW